ncbi:hypothetical protein G4B88_001055 [Cannabis sativa]|uniref:Uncharacterized protein n=1 Tax=Cannabis sativa TaxID=3483 RepID=A0A7J6DP58_CANSA|nr:hypothetical protein G4B88_001055 [Cannabis sativa]
MLGEIVKAKPWPPSLGYSGTIAKAKAVENEKALPVVEFLNFKGRETTTRGLRQPTIASLGVVTEERTIRNQLTDYSEVGDDDISNVDEDTRPYILVRAYFFSNRFGF